VSPLPLDAYERRADWLAALIVAMVVVPGFAAALAEPPPRTRPEGVVTTAPRRTRTVRGASVRPPRSC